MNLARALVNDSEAGATGTPGEGRTLTDGAPFVLPFLNSAIQTAARRLENVNVTTFTVDEFIMTVPAMPNPDPGVQVNISYVGYFDGTGNNPTPLLPSDILIPLELWERPTGTTLDFQPMNQVSVLPSVLQGPRFGVWEWSQNQLNFLGCMQKTDLRLRYKSQVVPKLVQPDIVNFSNIIIGIADIGDLLGYLIAAKYIGARVGMVPPAITDEIEGIIGQLQLRFVRAQQAITYRRPEYDSRDSRQSGSGNVSNSFSGG